MAKRKPRKPKPLRMVNVSEAKLRTMLREATHSGLSAAIEHCSNFWLVSDGFKKYIDFQIKSESEALMAAVKVAIRTELSLRDLANRRRDRRRHR